MAITSAAAYPTLVHAAALSLALLVYQKKKLTYPMFKTVPNKWTLSVVVSFNMAPKRATSKELH